MSFPLRRALAIGGVVLVLALAAWAASRSGDDAKAGLTIGWGGSEGHPSCRYDASTRTIVAELVVDGHAPKHGTVEVTVGAYADENTSVPVGSASRTLHLDGTVHRRVTLTIAAAKAPHVDEDQEAACSLAVKK